MSLQIATTDSPVDVPWPDVYFRPEYGAAEQARGVGTWMSLIAADGFWQLPLLRRELSDGHWDAVSPYGYSGIFSAVTLPPHDRRRLATEAIEWLTAAGCVSVFLRESPMATQGKLECRSVKVVDSHPVRVVSLLAHDDMWAACEGRVRTAVRKAEKNGFTARVRSADADDFAASKPGFRSLYESTMLRVNANDLYLFNDDYYTALVTGLGEDLQIAEVIDQEGRTAAAALLMRHGNTQHYHLSGSEPSAARLGVNNLLLWESMTAGADAGCQNFVLGGGLSGDDSLYRFKKSFGGRMENFSATGYVLDEDLFSNQIQLTALRQDVAPEDVASRTYFPQYRSV